MQLFDPLSLSTLDDLLSMLQGCDNDLLRDGHEHGAYMRAEFDTDRSDTTFPVEV